MKTLGSYVTGRNGGVEFGIREDGAVFTRTTQWSNRYSAFVTTKWKRDMYWEAQCTFAELPKTVRVGFATHGPHMFVENSRLRLPK